MPRKYPQPHEAGYTIPRTVAELRAWIDAGKAIAARRLREHADDTSQPEASRDVCRIMANRMRASASRKEPISGD
jgi:hypothetical protein